MGNEIDFVNEKFNTCFRDKGYKKINGVDISSGIDPSVTYIGSGISVLKKDLLSDNISNKGEYIIQKAIRTQNLKNIYDLNVDSRYYSFFEALAVLRKYKHLDLLFDDMISFFSSYLNIDKKDLLLRVNYDDKDFVNIIEKRDIKFEYNTEDPKMYTHKYGLDDLGIHGRNLNIAIRNKNTNIYDDVGNLIIIESSSKKYGCEFAVGIQPILMATQGKKYSLECSYIAEFLPLKKIEERKFAEAFVVVANLLNENIEDNIHRYPKYLYKKYLKALSFYMKTLKLDEEFVRKTMLEYLEKEYKGENNQNIKLKLGGKEEYEENRNGRCGKTL